MGEDIEEKTTPTAEDIPDDAKLTPGKIFVGGLSWDTTDDDLREYFGKLGEVEEAVTMKDKFSGHSRGFGFVIFADADVANDVVQNRHEIHGRLVEAKLAVPRQLNASGDKAKSRKVFVGGIAPGITEQEFRLYFEEQGEVVDAQLMCDPSSGRSRGFGFVTFADDNTVEKLMGEEHVLGGKRVEIKHAIPKGAMNLRGRNGTLLHGPQSMAEAMMLTAGTTGTYGTMLVDYSYGGGVAMYNQQLAAMSYPSHNVISIPMITTVVGYDENGVPYTSTAPASSPSGAAGLSPYGQGPHDPFGALLSGDYSGQTGGIDYSDPQQQQYAAMAAMLAQMQSPSNAMNGGVGINNGLGMMGMNNVGMMGMNGNNDTNGLAMNAAHYMASSSPPSSNPSSSVGIPNNNINGNNNNNNNTANNSAPLPPSHQASSSSLSSTASVAGSVSSSSSTSNNSNNNTTAPPAATAPPPPLQVQVPPLTAYPFQQIQQQQQQQQQQLAYPYQTQPLQTSPSSLFPSNSPHTGWITPLLASSTPVMIMLPSPSTAGHSSHQMFGGTVPFVPYAGPAIPMGFGMAVSPLKPPEIMFPNVVNAPQTAATAGGM